jgi:hypothetical protein
MIYSVNCNTKYRDRTKITIKYTNKCISIGFPKKIQFNFFIKQILIKF